MQQELLLHAMLTADVDSIKIKTLLLELEKEASSSNISGYMLIHKKEVVHYMTGNEEMISSLVSQMNSSGYFTLIKSLHQGIREEDCLGNWNFVNFFESEVDSNLNSEAFLAELQLVKSASVGLKLFTSISEIVLSERLYGLT